MNIKKILWLLLASMLVSCASVEFPEAPDKSLITTGDLEIIVEDNVRYHLINLVSRNSKYTSTMIETETGLIIVDLAPAIPNAGTELRAYADAIGKPISIIITHDHSDHFGNISGFTDRPVYVDSESAAYLAKDADFTAMYKGKITPVDTSISLGGLDFKFGSVMNAETKSNGYISIPSKKVLFPGDLVYNNVGLFIREYTPLDGGNQLSNWIDGLEMLKTKYGNYSRIFVAHTGTRTDIVDLVDENINFLTDAMDLIAQEKELTSGGFASSNKEVIDELKLLHPNYSKGAIDFALPNSFFEGDKGAVWFN